METDRYRVEGMLTLPREGYRSRVSDYVNRRDQEFFTMSTPSSRRSTAQAATGRRRCSCSPGATSG